MPPNPAAATHRHDVIVLGSGMAGTTIAAVLARRGVDVVVLEKHAHPRFAIGESMLPQSALWLWMLARRFDVEQIGHLSHLDAIVSHVSTRVGRKRTFGFAYHEHGRPADPAQTHKLIPPDLPFVQESHLLREDTDAYLLQAAVRHGAAYRDHATVDAIDVDDDGVAVRLDDGTTYRGRYLLDGSGYRSQLAARYGLREEPTRLRTRSRTIFTHVEGLPPYDGIIDRSKLPAGSQGFHDGTLHHVFDGGWFWVIPFGNHAGATSDVTSLGVTLDLDRFPATDVPAEVEFRSLVARFPTVARHLRDVTPVRPFVKTGRIQYSSVGSAGPRCFLLPHSAGFVDPLYSQGLVSTFEAVYALTLVLCDALQDDDLTPARFAGVEAMQTIQLDAADRLVRNGYLAMRDFATWNAWTHLWMATKLFGDISVTRTCLRSLAADDPTILDEALARVPATVNGPAAPEYQRLMAIADRQLADAAGGRTPPAAAAEAILSQLRTSPWLPHRSYGWGDPAATHVDFTPARLAGVIAWGKLRAPAPMRRDIFDFPLWALAREEVRRRSHDRHAGEGPAVPRPAALRP